MKTKKDQKMYYLYHIPGKKIGMTSNIYNRVIKQQGYKPGEFEILESSTDLKAIEDLEKLYQKRYGYKNDLNSYTDAKNSPINQFKSNKKMYTNVTAQTVTFPVPIKQLKTYLIIVFLFQKMLFYHEARNLLVFDSYYQGFSNDFTL